MHRRLPGPADANSSLPDLSSGAGRDRTGGRRRRWGGIGPWCASTSRPRTALLPDSTPTTPSPSASRACYAKTRAGMLGLGCGDAGQGRHLEGPHLLPAGPTVFRQPAARGRAPSAGLYPRVPGCGGVRAVPPRWASGSVCAASTGGRALVLAYALGPAVSPDGQPGACGLGADNVGLKGREAPAARAWDVIPRIDFQARCAGPRASRSHGGGPSPALAPIGVRSEWVSVQPSVPARMQSPATAACCSSAMPRTRCLAVRCAAPIQVSGGHRQPGVEAAAGRARPRAEALLSTATATKRVAAADENLMNSTRSTDFITPKSQVQGLSQCGADAGARARLRSQQA